MSTDTSEKGLESLIVKAMTGRTDLLSPPHVATDTAVPVAGGTGWLLGDANDYDRSTCVDVVQLRAFLSFTQPALVEMFSLATDGPTRKQFLSRIETEVRKRGVVDVLRKGIDHGAHHVDLFFGTPSPGNAKAAALNTQNRFSVSRQFRYSTDATKKALDLGLFVNGLPIATFELKNSLTKQTVADAVKQYQLDRDPKEALFGLGRCIAHFAVDDSEVRFCPHLEGKKSWFLPFNRGYNDGAGNPPNPDGLKTDYLWKRILTPASVTNILENYAQLVEEKNEQTGKKKWKQVFPRYHQLDVVRKVLADVAVTGPGDRYLIQHSAGSGKSNSIAWLAHQLISVKKDNKEVFDSVIVVTDRKVLDKQIHGTIKGFLQVAATVGHADHSGDLRKFIESGKKIIITTVQKFPFILGEIGEQQDKTFAIIIDEAHSSQGGKATSAMSKALGAPAAPPKADDGDDEDPEDTINNELQRRMDARKMLKNASYFAFTATPKPKTLQIFGQALPPDVDGKVQHRPFHAYTMKQAVQEGFILDVLKTYTPVESYYKLIKTVGDDPEYDVKKARKKLRAYVESHETAIERKAEIMVDHFHEQVLAKQKLGGRARAMVVTGSISRAIEYYRAFTAALKARKSPYRAIVAFSGDKENFHDEFVDQSGKKLDQVSEASINGFRATRLSTASRPTRIGFSSAPTSSRPATTNRCCTRCTSTRCSRASRPCRRCRG
jgi:type I restriction enzyme R subunit